MTDSKEFVLETWTYAGVRDDGGKRTHAWIDPVDGKARYWPDRRSYAVGALYETLIRRDPAKDVLSRRGDPMPTGRRSGDSDQIAEWEIKSEQAERRIRRASAEKRFKNNTVLDEACEPICEIAAKVRSFNDLESLITSVRQRLYEAWEKK